MFLFQQIWYFSSFFFLFSKLFLQLQSHWSIEHTRQRTCRWWTNREFVVLAITERFYFEFFMCRINKWLPKFLERSVSLGAYPPPTVSLKYYKPGIYILYYSLSELSSLFVFSYLNQTLPVNLSLLNCKCFLHVLLPLPL